MYCWCDLALKRIPLAKALLGTAGTVPSKPNAFSAYFTAAHYIRPKSDDEIAKHYEPIQASNLNEIGIVQGCTAPDATGILVSAAASPQMAQ
jgi:hypothetical protein